MHQKYASSKGVIFCALYITEAHAKNEWPVGPTISFCDQPTTNEDRMKLAQLAQEKSKFTFPFLVDTLDNHFENAYSSWPFRYYGFKDGKLEFKAQPDMHPEYTYNVARLSQWLDQL